MRIDEGNQRIDLSETDCHAVVRVIIKLNFEVCLVDIYDKNMNKKSFEAASLSGGKTMAHSKLQKLIKDGSVWPEEYDDLIIPGVRR